ncbi:MAG: erythromycin biosynthesis sensory transduction protein eryC1 [Ignavibacteria bacterium RIFOXYB2_FULL_35_12]|nr:MAG: erythromycin biosynthesis sensory transduction protein eryC1 [Ignavibacteria bacterium GWC2_35_8]OGU61350.1 MAG: erythromycin biosynthesis sensory transduction protein eryC1 [Ignavibacteria bacterium GWF2_35_20]OGU78723.1 MAG: erythromycin biosynthesis sensory transduction protein eryC1 [Ignavibacteria bacterium RIFOXYA2_FULL_35_9]OGU88438.1 MAG: erythromycin biosynthesis sensory transduction protein eryC1 [Ignavibacteria bacterium RIFOXYA12_FULL_35_25]OGU92475.1 MAG: erythromycin biosy
MIQTLIPVSNPKPRFMQKKQEFLNALDSVIERGMYILGDEVSSFEREFAEYLGVKHCVGVANGTDAIAVALKGLGVKPGDEVITVSHSAVATVAAIEMTGAIPVFADIEPDTRCIDPNKIEKLISPKTKVIIPVHIYGQPAKIKEIISVAHSRNIKVLEDCAQAHGAKVGDKKVGSFGDAAAFSFYPTKNLGAIGDGGAIVTNSSEVFENVLALRQYGWRHRYISDFPGVNSRLDEIQAAFLRIKLRELDKDNARRNEIAKKYSSAIKNLIRQQWLKAPVSIPDTIHVYHLYVIESKNRDELAKFLNSKGIGTALHYPLPIHLQPAYKGRFRGGDALHQTELLYKNILSIPMYPELSELDVERVTKTFKEWIKIKQ